MAALKSIVVVTLGLSLAGCLPPEIDTPPLNGKSLADEANGTATCVPGTYAYAVGQSQTLPVEYAGECDVPGVEVTDDPEKLRLMKHIKHVSGYVTLMGTTDLATALPDLESCVAISVGTLSGPVLTSPKNLTKLDMLQVNGSAIQTLSGFDNITALKALKILNCPNLTTISGFSNLTTIVDLDLSANPKLTSANIFNKVTQIGNIAVVAKYLQFPDKNGNTIAATLPELPNFPQLLKVTEGFNIANQPWTKINGFPLLQTTKSLTLTGMAKLNTLDFPQLTDVHVLFLSGMPLLTTLAGLPKVQVTQQLTLCVSGVDCKEAANFGLEHAKAFQQKDWGSCNTNPPAPPCKQ